MDYEIARKVSRCHRITFLVFLTTKDTVSEPSQVYPAGSPTQLFFCVWPAVPELL